MKRLIGHDLGSYAFNAAAGTVTFSGLPAFTQDQILLVTDTKTGAILYNFADPSAGGTLVGAVLTLATSTASLSNTDPLQIYLDLPADGAVLLASSVSAAGPGAAISTQGLSSVVLQTNGTWTGTLWLEGSNDQSAGSWGELMVMSLDELVGQDVISINGAFALKVSTLYVRVNVLTLTGTVALSMVGRTSSGDYGADRLTQALDQNSGVGLTMTPGSLGGQQGSRQSFPVTLASDQAQDLWVSGPNAMFQVGLNMLTGTSAGFDTLAGGTTSYRSFGFQINDPLGTISVTFQGNNDGSANRFTLPVYDGAAITGTAIQAAIAITAGTYRFFQGHLPFRYLWIYVSTAAATGPAQAIGRLCIADLAPPVLSVGQPTAANLNATVVQATAASLNATVQPGNTANTTAWLMNIGQWGGAATVNGGVAGVVGVGGNIAPGAAATANPVPIGGIDTTMTLGVATPKTRMALMDPMGRLQVGLTGFDATGTARQLGATPPAFSPMGVTALPVINAGASEGQTVYDLLQQILLEAKIHNQILTELPTVLSTSGMTLNDPQEYRADPSIFPN